MQALGALTTHLQRAIPEIVLGNAYLLQDRLQNLSATVRDVHELACSVVQERPELRKYDVGAQVGNFRLLGAPIPHRSDRFTSHFSTPRLSNMALKALIQCLQEDQRELSQYCTTDMGDELEVLVFSHANVRGHHVTSLRYTRSVQRISYHVAVLQDSSSSASCEYATIMMFFLLRHRATQETLARLVMLSPYTKVPCSLSHVGVVQLTAPTTTAAHQHEGMFIILPLSNISTPCIFHTVGDALFAVELWRNDGITSIDDATTAVNVEDGEQEEYYWEEC